MDSDLHSLPGKTNLDSALNDLASRAESNAYPQSDNISAIALRMLDPSTTHYNTNHSTQTVETESGSDTVSHAINAINKAMEDYSDEMDYDPKTK